MALRAVTFDLWETLLLDSMQAKARRNRLRIEVTERLLRGWGHPYPLEHVSDAFEEARRTWADLRTRYTELSLRQKMVTFLATVDPALLPALAPQQVEELAMAHSRVFFESPPAIAPGAPAAVRELAALGLRLGVISNTGATPGFAIRRLLQGAGFGNLFSALMFSDELGVVKPARAAFQVTLHRLAVGPHEAVHVGNDPVQDVMGAQAAGMRAVLLAAAMPEVGEHTPDAVALDWFDVVRIIRGMVDGETP